MKKFKAIFDGLEKQYEGQFKAKSHKPLLAVRIMRLLSIKTVRIPYRDKDK